MRDRLAKLLNTKVDNTQEEEIVSSPFHDVRGFPLVIRPGNAGLILKDWVRRNQEFVSTQLKKYGAILFRDFHVNNVEKFQQFISVMETSALEYTQRSSPRYEVAPNIYHSTTYPADQAINMHSENSYSVNAPGKIVFCCLQPAAEQGETPIADTRLVLAALSPRLREKFLDKGVRYVRNMETGIGLSWREVFQTSNKSAVEAECLKSGMSFKWEGDERLELAWCRDAIHIHAATREPVWFNHAFFFHKYAMDREVREGFRSDRDLPFNTYFGDGSEISEADIGEIRSAYAGATVSFPWEKGDVLLLDNLLMAHGRSPYKGERKIIVSMF